MSDVAPFFSNHPIPQGSQTPEQKSIDTSAIEIRPCSIGKLSTPARIYIRDYSLDDSLLLATSSEQNFFRHLVCVLNNIVSGEGFRAEDLHESEMEEILLTIFASFWQKTIEFPYYPTDEELSIVDEGTRTAIEKGDFKPKYEIELLKLETHPLPENFKEPLVIQHDGHSYIFRLPRVGDYLLAEDYTLQMFAFKEKDFQDIENNVAFNQEMKEQGHLEKMIPIDPERYRAYKEFMEEKGRTYLKIQQYQTLVGLDGKMFNTLEEKLAVSIPLGLWRKVKNVFDKKCKFGVDHKVKILSPLTKKEREMNAPFQLMDLIPTRDSGDDSEVEVQFGL